MNKEQVSPSGQVRIITNDYGLFTIKIIDKEGTETCTLDESQFNELKALLQ